MRMILILVLCAIGAVAFGCDDSDSESERPTVVATTGVIASLAEEVAGDDADVVQLIPDSSSPHDFSLSAQDRAELEEADLIVYNGAGLEAGVPIEEAESPKWALAEHAGPLLDGDNPHVWMNPTRVEAALPALADSLAEADPEHATAYRSRAERLGRRIDSLDRELSRRLAAVPDEDRELVTSHDALGYFAERYGFEIVATAFPAAGAEAEPSAEALAEVERAITETDVPAVFAEHEDDPQALEQVAEATGVEVVDELLVESPGETDGYEEMLRHDAELIASALGR
jgi:zinc/manganese transport system substrate-binding protein